MGSKTDRLMKRWQEQRWLLDTVIRTIGMEWDQGRLRYMSAPGGPEAAAEFRMVGARVKKAADIDREFVRAARRPRTAIVSNRPSPRVSPRSVGSMRASSSATRRLLR